MRRKDKIITDNSVIEHILNTSPVCRLGFIDDKYSYIVPVNFAYRNGYIYVHSAKEGRKIELIKQNPVVSFEMEDASEIIPAGKPCGWTAKYRSVMGTGTIRIENDPQLKKEGLDLIMAKYGAPPPFVYDEKILDQMIILVLKIETISGKQSGTFPD